jgi:hypothetical protein
MVVASEITMIGFSADGTDATNTFEEGAHEAAGQEFYGRFADHAFFYRIMERDAR